MKISVVIPVFNDIRVSRAIDSVLSQNNCETEIIVIDGGSTDDTLKVLDSYGKSLSIVVSEPDDGIFDAINKGIKLATGDIIGVLGSDDQFCGENLFSEVIDNIQTNDVDGCYGDLYYVNDNDKPIRYWRSGNYRRIKLYFGWIIPHFTLFLRRDVYEKYGVFDLRHRVAADYEYILKLLHIHKIKLKYIQKVVLRMTLGGYSNRSISNIIQGNVDAYMAWHNNKLQLGYLVPFLKPAQKLIQYLYAIHVNHRKNMASIHALSEISGKKKADYSESIA